ncbi:MAG: hypothetical protein AB4368_21405 [Xenococcaceae cyanobacterium]
MSKYNLITKASTLLLVLATIVTVGGHRNLQAQESQETESNVTIIVRPYIQSEFERDYDLTWDLDLQEKIEAEYREKPVLIVDSIYPSAQDQGLLE